MLLASRPRYRKRVNPKALTYDIGYDQHYHVAASEVGDRALPEAEIDLYPQPLHAAANTGRTAGRSEDGTDICKRLPIQCRSIPDTIGA